MSLLLKKELVEPPGEIRIILEMHQKMTKKSRADSFQKFLISLLALEKEKKRRNLADINENNSQSILKTKKIHTLKEIIAF